MRNLISNLNVIRDTRISGILRSGFNRISTIVVDLDGRLLEFLLPEMMPEALAAMPANLTAKPIAADFGKPLYAIGGEKPGATDRTCPWHPRSTKHSHQRSCLGNQEWLVQQSRPIAAIG